jgi:hypothetical protein
MQRSHHLLLRLKIWLQPENFRAPDLMFCSGVQKSQSQASLCDSPPAKNLQKSEDSELTVMSNWIICSSRDAGPGDKPGVLPLLAHARADRSIHSEIGFCRCREVVQERCSLTV